MQHYHEFTKRNFICDFVGNEAGNFAVITAISAAMLLGVSGAAFDYALRKNNEASLQEVLDASVLAGITASDTKKEQIEAAESHYESMVGTIGSVSLGTPTFYHNDAENLVATVSAEYSTTMLKFVNVNSLPINIVSEATKGSWTREPMCFMAMHPHDKHTLELNGSVSVFAPDCHIYGNSDHPYDVVDPHKPANFMTAASIQAIGYGHHYIQNLTPPLEYAPELIPDPYKDLALPAGGPCDFEDVEITNAAKSLSPGTYCGGLELSRNAAVTMQPGLYFIRGGDFKIEENSSLSGSGVTIVLAGDADINWEESEVVLSAPDSGAWKSFVIVRERVETKHEFVDSRIDLHGIVYDINGFYEWENKGRPKVTADWTVWIIEGVSWSGNGHVDINFDIVGSDVPFPSDLMNIIPRPPNSESVRLVR